MSVLLLLAGGFRKPPEVWDTARSIQTPWEKWLYFQSHPTRSGCAQLKWMCAAKLGLDFLPFASLEVPCQRRASKYDDPGYQMVYVQ